MKKITRHIRYLIEAFFVYVLYGFFYVLPLDWASAVGGWVLEKVGPHIGVSNIARKNIKMVMPELSEERREEIVRGMWNNIGRMVGELPHWRNMSKEQIEERMEFDLEEEPRSSGLYISGHFGNFELAAVCSKKFNLNAELVHRPANNPYVNWLINYGRESCGSKLHKKGIGGVKSILKTLQNGGLVGMLVDQRTNNGIDVPFFGKNAKTTPAPANFALRYGIPVMFGRMKRKKGAYYINSGYKPIKIKKGDTAVDVMTRINAVLEEWIREAPEQWFWLHKRWGKIWDE